MILRVKLQNGGLLFDEFYDYYDLAARAYESYNNLRSIVNSQFAKVVWETMRAVITCSVFGTSIVY